MTTRPRKMGADELGTVHVAVDLSVDIYTSMEQYIAAMNGRCMLIDHSTGDSRDIHEKTQFFLAV
jgi:hypothetical protein